MRGSTTLRLIIVAALAGVSGLVNVRAVTASPSVDARLRTGPAAVAALSAELRHLSANTARFSVRRSTGNVTFVGASPAHPLQAGNGGSGNGNGNGNGDAGPAARRFVNRYGAMFGVADPNTDLTQAAVVTSSHGDAVRFQQRFRGVPVLAGQVAVQMDAAGAVVSTTGEASPRLAIDVQPSIDPSAAAATARAVTVRADAIAPAELTVTTPELTVYDPSLIDAPDRFGPRLVWKAEVRNALGDVDRLVLVDAHTGAVAFHFSQVERALQQQVCDNQNIPGSETCTEPVVFDGSESTDADQAARFAAQTYNFYLDTFGRDSIDGAGMPILSTVRYCPASFSDCVPPHRFANAFWNGEQMVYGAGWATADDVVGHELTHGVTQHTSGLLYYADAGAINESMSDVMGELIDQQTPDNPSQLWLLGEDLPGGPIRSMSNPPAFGDPDSVLSPNFYTGLLDNRGVHRNSGVSNKAAYLIAQATSPTKAAWIYYEAETTLLGPGSDYSDLFNVLPQACINLIGTGSLGIVEDDCQQVVNAVTATGMNQHPPSGNYWRTAPVCDSGVQTALQFHDDTSTPGNWVGTTTGGAAAWGYLDDVSATGGKTLHVLDAAGPAGTSTLTGQKPIPIPFGTTFLRLDHSFNTDWLGSFLYDGGVVEYSADGGGTWADLGALAVNNGYDDTITPDPSVGPVNALAGRAAFGTISPNVETSRFDLSSLAGQTIRLRFIFATDSFPKAEFDGWFIDDLSVYSCGAANLPGPPDNVTAAPGTASAMLSWSSPTFTGGAPITGYRITPYVNGVAQTPVDTVDATPSATVPNLLGATPYRFTVAARNATGLGPTSAFSTPVTPPSDFSSLAPARLLETRLGRSTVDGLFNGLGVRGAGTVTALTVSGRGGVAADAAAVALNVTVTEAQADGYLTVYPCGGDPPTASNLNYVAGSTVPNAVVSKVGTNGQVCFFTQSPVQLVVDTNGFFSPTSTLVPLVPARLLDSRPGAPTVDGQSTGIGMRAAGSFTQVQVTDRAGIPPDASAAVLNMTVTGALAPGYATVYPCGSSPPTASNLNYGTGSTVANAAVSKIGKGGRVCVFTQSPLHLVVDVVAYFPANAVFAPLVPARLLETRLGLTTVDGQSQGIGLRSAGSLIQIQVTGRAGVPASATAVAINVTITGAQAPGYATVYPCSSSPPNASNLNYSAGATVANLVLAKLGTGGTVCVFTQSGAHVVVDISGFFPG